MLDQTSQVNLNAQVWCTGPVGTIGADLCRIAAKWFTVTSSTRSVVTFKRGASGVSHFKCIAAKVAYRAGLRAWAGIALITKQSRERAIVIGVATWAINPNHAAKTVDSLGKQWARFAGDLVVVSVGRVVCRREGLAGGGALGALRTDGGDVGAGGTVLSAAGGGTC